MSSPPAPVFCKSDSEIGELASQIGVTVWGSLVCKAAPGWVGLFIRRGSYTPLGQNRRRCLALFALIASKCGLIRNST